MVNCWIGYWPSKNTSFSENRIILAVISALTIFFFPYRMISITLTSAWFLAIRKDSRYTEKDAAVVVRQMLRVAAECHLHGLVHRDMKPEV